MGAWLISDPIHGRFIARLFTWLRPCLAATATSNRERLNYREVNNTVLAVKDRLDARKMPVDGVAGADDERRWREHGIASTIIVVEIKPLK